MVVILSFTELSKPNWFLLP